MHDLAMGAVGSKADADSPKTYADLVVEGLKEHDVEIVTALPESLLIDVYRKVAADPAFIYVQAASEQDLPGVVAGAYLAGKRSVMFMENSGLREACEPIARLIFGHRMPMVMVMPHRGDLGEYNWWGHGHSLTMEPLLKALGIPHWPVRKLEEIKPSIKRALIHADAGQTAVALIFGGDCVEVPHYAKD
jgi:sulfopyruvate decarboxylase subunit alpha